MSNFLKFKSKIQAQLEIIAITGLFVVDVDKDLLWNTYLDSFPEGTNEIYKERRQYDCQCCKQFIRTVGNLVTIVDNKYISIWDIYDAPDEFAVVADALSQLIHAHSIKSPFLHYESHAGTDSNIQLLEDKTTIKWEHFYAPLPKSYVDKKDSMPSAIGRMVEDKQVLRRSLDELSIGSADIVLELISQNSLYRGDEHKSLVQLFLQYKTQYDEVPESRKDNFCWISAQTLMRGGRFRNTVIGTLLTDLSDGMELTDAVTRFEKKVAPENYKRPTALITQSMITKAQEKVEELGLTTALPRRYATLDDITINNVIYADRAEKKAMNAFDELGKDVAIDKKSFSRVEKVPVDVFISEILPKAEGIELLLENKHLSNLMSVIAPVSEEANPLLKWDNNFSWSYNGEVTDSIIKERVKNAGGDVSGVLRCSLSWFNADDLDIHVIEPGGNRIYFSDKINHRTGGRLDVDMNAGSASNSIDPVENITWPDLEDMDPGKYTVIVNNYNKRSKKDVGFDVEIEYQGNIYSLSHPKDIENNKNIVVAYFDLDKSCSTLDIKSDLDHKDKVKKVWGISTNSFHRVRVIMNSPNHWDGQSIGNKHWFFILEDCNNPEQARGLFNEFLRGDLTEHRKVFEMLGSKMKVELSDNQLSGIGFSSTQRNSIFCKIKGSFERTIEIVF